MSFSHTASTQKTLPADIKESAPTPATESSVFIANDSLIGLDSGHDDEALRSHVLSLVYDDKVPSLCVSTKTGSATVVDHGNPAGDDPSPASVDLNREWEIDEILGQEEIGGQEFFWVGWEPTLEPADALPEHLIREF